jgi:RNA polymerase sigma-70 factor (ECF subfamily)
MISAPDDRSLWLATRVLPHEPAIRRWLQGFSALAEADIDDLIQETYAVLATRPSVAEIVDPRSYAFQVAKSLCLQGFRRAKIVSIHAVADLTALDLPDEAPSPFEHVAGREDLHQVIAAIEAMPPQTRRAFQLRRIDGLSQREVAAATNLSENTVEKHIGRGIRILMAKFGRGGKAARGASPLETTAEDTADALQESATSNARARDSRSN